VMTADIHGYRKRVESALRTLGTVLSRLRGISSGEIRKDGEDLYSAKVTPIRTSQPLGKWAEIEWETPYPMPRAQLFPILVGLGRDTRDTAEAFEEADAKADPKKWEEQRKEFDAFMAEDRGETEEERKELLERFRVYYYEAEPKRREAFANWQKAYSEAEEAHRVWWDATQRVKEAVRKRMSDSSSVQKS